MNRDDTRRDLVERFRESSRSLNELERRRWAAAEAIKLGRGGISFVSNALHMSRSTIRKGIEELATNPLDTRSDARVRKPGGGRRLK